MDRPLGPRKPDKRNEAFESIFGRPTASHHHLPPPPNASYPQQHTLNPGYSPSLYSQNGYSGYSYQAAPPPPPAQTAQHLQYQQGIDRRTSYNPSAYPHTQHAYYPSPSPRPSHAQVAPQPSSSPHAHLGPPNPRAQSIVSAPRSPGIIAPQPEEPPDAALEELTRRGLTPAQAYQAQVNRSSPQANHAELVPRIGLDFEDDNGGLGLDFVNNGEQLQRNSHQELADASELPWASAGQSPNRTPIVQPQRMHQPTHRSNLSAGSGLAPSPDSLQNFSSSRPHPLQLDTAALTSRGSVVSTSPASSTLIDHHPASVQSGSSSSRRSSESSRTMPAIPPFRRERTAQDRSMSMSAASSSIKNMLGGPRPPLPFQDGRTSSVSTNGQRSGSRRTPIVYPAMLSRVALALRERVTLADRVKDGLEYKDAFDGRDAVDKIAYIIKTTDRNLALLLGRALDAQKFFHDVTYDHRLRDSANELYQFRTKIPSPFVSGELPALPEGSASPPPAGDVSVDSTADLHSSVSGPESPSASTPPPGGRAAPEESVADDVPIPSGVFTLLTDCYSPTCSRDQLCYSIACPRRLEQQARLNMKPQPGLKKEISKESLGDLVEPGTLWIHSVPKEIVDSVSDQEKKRQEAINEVIYTERDFVRDMEYLRDSWINALKDSDVIPAARRTDFLEQVFWNIHDIIAVNTRLRDALNKRQRSYAVVERIGDILLDAVPHFGPFVSYGAHQLYGKYEFEKEKGSNPAFAAFVETTERMPESRKLELNGYLTKPTTRLARYPLLLEAVLKHTPEDNPDRVALPQAVALVREFLGRVNIETGRAENRFNLLQLDQQLVFRQGEEVDLRLKEEGRELVYKGALNKRGGTGQGDAGDLQVYLFDHALLMVKQKTKNEQYKVYRRPIPLELLLISAVDDYANPTTLRPGIRKPQALTKRGSFNKGTVPYAPVVPIKSDGKSGFAITFVHLGRKHYQISLWAGTYVGQRKWVEAITKQQEIMRERSMIFDTQTLSEGFFVGANKVNCAAPFSGGRRVVYGTDDGVYLSDLREPNRAPVKVLALLDVSQVDFLEDYQLLIVLSERQVITFPLEALDPIDPLAGLKRGKRISSHTTFFKAGMCLGRSLVCIVKSSPLSSTIKALEPIDSNVRGRSKPTFRKLLQGGNDTLRPFKEFYIPVESSSIHFLKTRLCVGCSKGFEIVDLETLDTQTLLDPADDSMDFIKRRENLKPMAIYRIDNEFLLCYDEFAFYVNRSGWRSRKEFMVHWEGSPTGFAMHYPYVLAFEPTFVEIRHVDTGLMSQVIQGSNLRLLFADTPPSTTNSASQMYGFNPYQPQPQPQAGYNPYGPGPGYGGGRQSVSSGYGGYHGHPHQQMYGGPGVNPYVRPPPNYGRDEILMVSDDRVLALRLASGQTAQMLPDNASMVSMPR